MAKHKRVDVSGKGRRLVERAVQLHVQKAQSIFQGSPATGYSWEQAKKDRDAMARRTRESKQRLLEYIAVLEKRAKGETEMRRELSDEVRLLRGRQ